MKRIEIKNFNHEKIFPLLLADLRKDNKKVVVGDETHQITVYSATSVTAHEMLAKDISVNGRDVGRIVVSRFPTDPPIAGYLGDPPNGKLPLLIVRQMAQVIEGDHAVQTAKVPKVKALFFYKGIPNLQHVKRNDDWKETIPLP